MKRNCLLLLLFLSFIGFSHSSARAQKISSLDRGRALSMLDNVAKDIQKHYYDSNFHGVDWNAIALKAKEQIQSESSLNMAMADIAQALVSLNDSHTFFIPPPRPFAHTYGFQTEIVGDRCYILRVRPGTDAETKGLKPGDELISWEGFTPNRDTLWKIEYRYNLLRPARGVRIFLRDPQGQKRQVDVTAKFVQRAKLQDLTGNNVWGLIRDAESEEELRRPRWAEAGDDVAILKLPEFLFDLPDVESMIHKARKYPGLIVDLRGNPGGSVDSLRFMLGGMFDRDITLAQRVGRKEFKPEVANSRHHGAFSGKLVVLLDSRSASAAELFARIVQLEKRGVVVGDRSSGSVMEAKRYSYSQGDDVRVFYGAEITEADLIMSDGKSLEHVGVTPDEVVLPTAQDLAAGRDPVLSHAAALLGAKLSPEDAGKLFPYTWPKD